MKKSEWVDKVLKLKPQQRIKKFKGQKKQLVKKDSQKRIKKVQRVQKKKLMPYQLVQLCNQNKIYTIRSLNQYNRTHQEKISISSIFYWFGTWKSFKRRLDYVDCKQKEFTYDQVINACVRFQINSKTKYMQANKKQPTIFPKYSWVVRNFGCWKYFEKILQACSVQHMLWLYVRKKIQLGRYPTKNQCKKYHIELQMLQQVWTNDQLLQLVKMLQGVYKNAK